MFNRDLKKHGPTMGKLPHMCFELEMGLKKDDIFYLRGNPEFLRIISTHGFDINQRSGTSGVIAFRIVKKITFESPTPNPRLQVIHTYITEAPVKG